MASVSGLMMIGLPSPIAVAKGLTVEVAAVGVMIIAIFDFHRQAFLGIHIRQTGQKKHHSDRLLVATAVAQPVCQCRPGLMILSIGIMGFAYGGFLGIFPRLTADYWGPKHRSQLRSSCGVRRGCHRLCVHAGYYSKTWQKSWKL
ncbi:MAG: hypothetical protein R2864_08125 [Syntrophotaleaceae bacterium]